MLLRFLSGAYDKLSSNAKTPEKGQNLVHSRIYTFSGKNNNRKGQFGEVNLLYVAVFYVRNLMLACGRTKVDVGFCRVFVVFLSYHISAGWTSTLTQKKLSPWR